MQTRERRGAKRMHAGGAADERPNRARLVYQVMQAPCSAARVSVFHATIEPQSGKRLSAKTDTRREAHEMPFPKTDALPLIPIRFQIQTKTPISTTSPIARSAAKKSHV